MIGIISAMEHEIECLRDMMDEGSRHEICGGADFYLGKISGKDVVLARSGIAKVYAAICAAALILKFKPDCVINLGVAGGIDTARICDVVIAEKTVQYDVDTTVFGYAVGQVPGTSERYFPCDKKLIQKLLKSAAKIPDIRAYTGIVATGDKFIDDSALAGSIFKEFGAVAVEMEGAAIAQTCMAHGVPCAIVRAISDDSGEDAMMTHEEFFDAAAENSAKIIKAFIDNWEE